MIGIRIFLADVKRLAHSLDNYKIAIRIFRWLLILFVIESSFSTNLGVKFINTCVEENVFSDDFVKILSSFRCYLHSMVLYLITLLLGFLLKPLLGYLTDINVRMTNKEVHCRKTASMLRIELDKLYPKTCNMSPDEKWPKISRLFFQYLVDRYSLDSYLFNLFMEELVEVGNEVSNRDLVSLLTDYLSAWNNDKVKGVGGEKNVDIAFSIWYLISLLYKKQIDQYQIPDQISGQNINLDNCLNELGVLVEKHWNSFKNYPLAWEVKSRWQKRIGETIEALNADKYAISHVKGEKTNHALLVSYVSTLCKILKDPGLSLSEHDIEAGREYINQCVLERPNYGGKYNRLRAKLTACIAEMKFQRGLISKIDYIKQLVAALNDVAEARKKDQNSGEDARNSATSDWNRCDWLQNELEKKFTLMSMSDKYVPYSECGKRCNLRQDISKPMEDYYIANDSYGIYIVMDGVTRPHNEYNTQQTSSRSFEVAKGVATSAYSYMQQIMRNEPSLDCQKIQKVLEDASEVATKAISHLSGNECYPPCAVGLISIVFGSRFHFIAMGDCIGVLLRGKSRFFFGTQSGTEALAKKNVPKDVRYSNYLNKNIEHGYAVFNGDATAISLACSGSFALERDDIVMLGTDGVKNYLKFTALDNLKTYSIPNMLQDSTRYDLQPFAKYADDKVIVRIKNRV